MLNDSQLAPTAQELARLETLLKYADHYGGLLPLCWPVGGLCGCGHNHEARDVGKAPLTPNGWHDASARPGEIKARLERFPSCNWGLVLPPQWLVIDPDSAGALAESQAQGLPPTILRTSRNDAFLYRRPVDCPTTNATKTGPDNGLDLLANGYLVVLGTHRDGTRIKLVGDTVADAPQWAVDILKGKSQPAPVERKPSAGVDAEPPVRLDVKGMELWTGENSVNGDRSEALFSIGMALKRAGATENTIADAVAERDDTLGYAKYSERSDDKEYLIIARKVTDGRQPEITEITDHTPPPDDTHCTDMGNAARLAARHGQDIRYCHAWGKWLVWDGRRWLVDEIGEVMRRAKDSVRSIYAEAASAVDDDRRSKLAKWAAASESEARIRSMVTLTQSEPGITIKPDHMDNDPWALNVLNGTLNLHTGELNPHRREDGITKLCRVEYDATATCPTFESFLKRIMDDKEKLIAFMRRMAGYCLTGDTREKAMFIFFGSGDNGKTTLTEAYAALMGDYAMRTPAETLLSKRVGSIPNDLARLKGARFVWTSETADGNRLAESTIKDITGRDTVSARFLHAEWFDFKPEFKLVLATNHRPVIRGTDPAIWKRIKLIPFEVSIPGHEQDKELPTKLLRELPGILSWAVRGCLLWQQEGLGIPEEVEQATAEYKADMDTIATFIEECCVTSSEAWALTADLYKTYTEWCGQSGEKALTQIHLGEQLGERGFIKKRGAGNKQRWRGLGIVDERGQ